ncbi:MAG: hypothetical protein M3Z32_09400, partial [Acidobacteriota bacterium]|nr:hypothetical protein [Acidobacteriota bacterium]
MLSEDAIHSAVFFRKSQFILAAILCVSFSTGSHVLAQDRAATGEPSPTLTASAEKPFVVQPEATPLPLAQADSTDQADAATSSGNPLSGQEVSAVPKRFQYAVRLNLRAVFDDNIFLRPSGRIADVYFAIEPGITLGFGDIVGSDANFVRIDYAPSVFLFTSHTEANAMQQLFRLDGRYRFGRLTFNLTQEIQLLEGPNLGATFGANASGTNPGPNLNLDTGGATDVNTFTTRADLAYDLAGKTFLSGGLLYT